MPIAEARVETDRASRYLVQLCAHANQMGTRGIHRMPATPVGHTTPAHVSAEWSETEGTIHTDGGTCTLTATDAALVVRVDATGSDELHRIRDAITRDLTRFSRRHPLTVHWTPARGDTRPDSPPAPGPPNRARRHRTLLLVAAGALALAAHAAAVVLSAPHWTSVAVDLVLVVVVVKVFVVGGHLTLRRRTRRKRAAEHRT